MVKNSNFKCSECNRHWKSSSTKENADDGQECRNCSTIVFPFKTIIKSVNPVSEKVDAGKTFLGCYNCLDCSRQWRSSQAKENSGQECRKCLKIVLPFELIEKKSKSSPKKLEGGQFFGRFNCLECNIEWKSSDTYIAQGQECIKCLKTVLPYVIISIKELKRETPFVDRSKKCLECKRGIHNLCHPHSGNIPSKDIENVKTPHQQANQLASKANGAGESKSKNRYYKKKLYSNTKKCEDIVENV